MNVKDKFKRFWTLSKNRKGFTLVELIVVIAILAILAGVAIPVYNGYIKKAENAADTQLLDSINTAFAAACITNGYDHVKAAGTTLVVNDNGTIATEVNGVYSYRIGLKYEGTAVADTDAEVIVADFAAFFVGNETAAFKNDEIKGLVLDSEGKFGPATDGALSQAATKLFNALQANPEAQEIIKNSKYYEIGVGTVLEETGNVLDWAVNDLNMSGGSAFTAFFDELIGFDESQFDLTTEEGALEAQEALGALVAPYGGYENAYNNALMLYAAKNSTTTTIEGVSKWLNGEKSTADFENEASGAALGEASAIYGLYIAYKGENYNADSTNPGNIFTNALSDKDFAEWVATDPNAQTELKAFQTSMALAGSDEIKEHILANGMNNEDLIAALGNWLG